MSRTLVALLDTKLVQHTISEDRPDDATDGVSIESWRTNGVFSGSLTAVFIEGSEELTMTSPTDGESGVEVWGYRFSQWWLIGYLNDGIEIPIAGALQGYAAPFNVVGVFERIAVAGTASAGTAVAKLAPIDTWVTP